MAKYYVTVGNLMTQATNTFSAVQTLHDGGTLSSIKVPPGMKRISVLGSALSHDVIAVIDTGNNFTLQLSGTGLVDGIQEFNVGALACQEVGTSVGASLVAEAMCGVKSTFLSRINPALRFGSCSNTSRPAP